MMPFRLGLTGSIGMGKSTTAGFFVEEGIPVWDADATVAAMYAPDGAATQIVAGLFPDVIVQGGVSRPLLRAKLAANPAVLDQLSAAVHPLVAASRAAFLAQTTAQIVVLDVPLLFETGSDAACDGVVVVTAPPAVQRQRVLARGEMTEAALDVILSRQMPDAEKRARATWIIETTDMDSARTAVKAVLADIRKRQSHA
jgi:dephospho-CoA kinase